MSVCVRERERDRLGGYRGALPLRVALALPVGLMLVVVLNTPLRLSSNLRSEAYPKHEDQNSREGVIKPCSLN